MTNILLPVSIGEALDKLTILDIKCKKINDERRVEVQKEYYVLYKLITSYVKKFPFHYKMLYKLNEEMWDLQDDIREEFNVEKCKETLEKNDSRFRIKDNINKLTCSELKEQKGYPENNALFIGHMGIGDVFGLNGAIRYLSLKHDKLYYICKQKYYENVKRIFRDFPSIIVVPNPNTVDDKILNFNFPFSFNVIYGSGVYIPNHHPMENLPDNFYKDLKLDPVIQRTYFYIDSFDMPIPDTSYIFIHSDCSTHNINFITWDIYTRLTINPNKNMYPEDHPWNKIAGQYIGYLVADYTKLIENADEIHVVDSAFYCLARYLSLKAKVKVCYDRSTSKPSEEYFL